MILHCKNDSSQFYGFMVLPSIAYSKLDTFVSQNLKVRDVLFSTAYI